MEFHLYIEDPIPASQNPMLGLLILNFNSQNPISYVLPGHDCGLSVLLLTIHL